MHKSAKVLTVEIYTIERVVSILMKWPVYTQSIFNEIFTDFYCLAQAKMNISERIVTAHWLLN